MAQTLLLQKSSLDVAAIFKAERQYYESLAQGDSFDSMPGATEKFTSLEKEVKDLRQDVAKFSKEVTSALAKLEQKLNSLNTGAPAPQTGKTPSAPAEKKPAAKDDDDVDLFGSDEEDEDAKKAREDLVKAHLEKKSKKPQVIAKSMIILDVKPWDDETDVNEMEKSVRSIVIDGLLWGTSKFVEIAYGIKKLQITCVVEDDKVSVDTLEEAITAFEELVQSIDIVAFNKI